MTGFYVGVTITFAIMFLIRRYEHKHIAQSGRPETRRPVYIHDNYYYIMPTWEYVPIMRAIEKLESECDTCKGEGTVYQDVGIETGWVKCLGCDGEGVFK